MEEANTDAAADLGYWGEVPWQEQHFVGGFVGKGLLYPGLQGLENLVRVLERFPPLGKSLTRLCIA